MRKGPVLTDAIRGQIEKMAASMKNPTPGKIARRLGLHVGTVNWFMLTRGMIAKKPPTYSLKPYVRNGVTINPYTPEQDAMLTAMRIENKTFQEIADALVAKFGIPRTAHSVQVRAVFLSAVDDESEVA